MGVCRLLEPPPPPLLLLLGGGSLEVEKCRTPKAPWQGGGGLAQAQQLGGEGCGAQPLAGGRRWRCMSSKRGLLPCSAPPHHSCSSGTKISHIFDPEQNSIWVRTPDGNLPAGGSGYRAGAKRCLSGLARASQSPRSPGSPHPAHGPMPLSYWLQSDPPEYELPALQFSCWQLKLP